MRDSNNLPHDLVVSAIAHMNAMHQQSLREYAHALAGLAWAEHTFITHIDTTGFEIVASAGSHAATARIAFDQPVTDAQQLRQAMVILAHRSRQILA